MVEGIFLKPSGYQDWELAQVAGCMLSTWELGSLRTSAFLFPAPPSVTLKTRKTQTTKEHAGRERESNKEEEIVMTEDESTLEGTILGSLKNHP